MVIHYITAAIIAVFAVLLFFTANQLNKRRDTAIRISALLFALLFLTAYLSGDDAIAHVQNMGLLSFGKDMGSGAFALVWLTTTAGVFLCLFPFFHRACPSFGYFSVFALLVFVSDMVCLPAFISAQTGSSLEEVSLRSGLLAAEVGFGLGYSVFALSISVKEFKRNAKQLGWVLLAFVGMLVCTLPNYTLQYFFNPVDYAMKVDDLNFWHRLYIYPAALIPLILYFALHGRKAESRRLALLYFTLAALWNYMSTQKIEMIWGLNHVGNWPLHLCNTALYVTPICLTFRLKKVFYFTYFINVFGAFLALTMPNYNMDGLNGTILMSSTVHFYRAHYQAFAMPLIIVGLGIFERPRLKQFIWSMVGFLFYYLLVLVLNGWFTNYDKGVDFFFINSDFIADKLGAWAESLRNFTWEFDLFGLHFCYYPIYQSLYFLVYCLLALALWFLYELAYSSISGWQDLARRKKKIKMDMLALQANVPHNGGAPMNENADILSINGFSKRYGRSDVYAVKDVHLNVKGGEIFGFLGPNGAGKSTIIKSIVGIQPITEGSISVCGYDVERQSVQAKLNIGFVPDHYALYEKLTAREYVNYIADLYSVPKAERDERMQRYVEIFELQAAVDKPISTYSHGMKQKVAIMAALIHNPKVWILDEPLTGLDPNSIYQVKECMKRHAEEGNAVFFSSHLIDIVERICDRIAIIRKGQIQCVCDVKEVEQDTTLERFYLQMIESKEVEPVPYREEKPTADAE